MCACWSKYRVLRSVDLRGRYVVEQRIEQGKSLQKIKIQSLHVFAPATTLKQTQQEQQLSNGHHHLYYKL